MDPSRDGGGGLTATGLFCGSCGSESSTAAKFCGECGTRLTQATQSAEYKQVTVLFADVVHSMDIAATVGPERLREIMTDLVNRAAVVVQRYGGTVGSFTGDGVMAVFGAPMALEDHAFRACLAALGVQEEAKRLAVDVQDRDGVELRLRVGLNSGQVIAGEIGSGSFGYTAVGEQVGMAQRMESVAPPGGVMLSASTARLVDGAAALGEPEMVRIKGADEPVPAREWRQALPPNPIRWPRQPGSGPVARHANLETASIPTELDFERYRHAQEVTDSMSIETGDTRARVAAAVALVRHRRRNPLPPDRGATGARASGVFQVNRVDRTGRALPGGWTFLVDLTKRTVVRTSGDPDRLDVAAALRRGTRA